MRHHNTNRKFGRNKNQRRALMSTLALSLILRGRIKTTLPKAKELKPLAEKLITSAKKNDITHKKAFTARFPGGKNEMKKLFDFWAPKYIDKKGGYTRIIRLGIRKSDASPMALIEFV